MTTYQKYTLEDVRNKILCVQNIICNERDAQVPFTEFYNALDEIQKQLSATSQKIFCKYLKQ